MLNNNATVNFIILRNTKDKDGKSPIRMVIYYGEAKKRYSVKLSVLSDDWDKMFAPKLQNKNLKTLKSKLDAIKVNAENVIAQLDPFSIVSFEELYFDPVVKVKRNSGLENWFNIYIADLKANGQVGTAISYQTTINSINKFKANLSLYDVTKKFLEDYEAFMIEDEKSTTTIGIYMRQLRSIINQAIKAKYIHADKYPFESYQIPNARNIKQALPSSDIQKLITFESENPKLQKAVDFWILSYLCNGMNFSDIAYLKPENITGTYLQFVRQKTKRTKKRDLTPIKVGLHPKAIAIIEKYRNKEEKPLYLFPILTADMTPLSIKYRCQHFIKWVNKQMATVQSHLKIQQPIPTYAARHSYASMLKRKGVPTSFIKEALGHSSEVTTESYLNSFSDEVKMQYANLLTDLLPPPVPKPKTRKKTIVSK
jgi:integrase